MYENDELDEILFEEEHRDILGKPKCYKKISLNTHDLVRVDESVCCF